MWSGQSLQSLQSAWSSGRHHESLPFKQFKTVKGIYFLKFELWPSPVAKFMPLNWLSLKADYLKHVLRSVLLLQVTHQWHLFQDANNQECVINTCIRRPKCSCHVSNNPFQTKYMYYQVPACTCLKRVKIVRALYLMCQTVLDELYLTTTLAPTSKGATILGQWSTLDENGPANPVSGSIQFF